MKVKEFIEYMQKECDPDDEVFFVSYVNLESNPNGPNTEMRIGTPDVSEITDEYDKIICKGHHGRPECDIWIPPCDLEEFIRELVDPD